MPSIGRTGRTEEAHCVRALNGLRLEPHQQVLLWMCALIGINQLGFGAMIPTLPLYAQSFGVAPSAIGLAVAAFGLARFASAIPAGQLSDRLGRRHSLAIGGLISVIGNFWCAWASSYPEFIAARFVAGFGAGMVLTTGQVVLADISTPDRRARTIAIYQATFLFSVWIGPFPGGLLAEWYGLTAPFVAYGIASLGATLVAWMLVAETKGWIGGLAARVGTPPQDPLSFGGQMKLLAAQPGFLLVSLISFMQAVARTGGLFAIIPLLATDKLKLSASAIGFAMMLSGIAGLVATYPAGWLADMLGRKWVIVPATLTTAASMLLFGWAPDYWWFIVACTVWSIASSIGGSAPAAYAVDCAPPGMNAAAISSFRMIADAGYVVGPIVLGLVADYFGALAALDVTAAALTLNALAFALKAPETLRTAGRAK